VFLFLCVCVLSIAWCLFVDGGRVELFFGKTIISLVCVVKKGAFVVGSLSLPLVLVVVRFSGVFLVPEDISGRVCGAGVSCVTVSCCYLRACLVFLFQGISCFWKNIARLHFLMMIKSVGQALCGQWTLHN
jgi:hypothetical protein